MSSMLRAFSRSRVLQGPGRSDVDIAMTKWWTKKRPTEGQVTRTISAHEQHPVGPWLRTFPKKVVERAPAYILWLGGSLGLTYGSIGLAQSLTDAEDQSHRP
mmetsp:Transcript_54454/g.82501  ORF Transcript_54454/g.82501 Transcript_54454/m.82501 type:complete len:102 (-) Transcript_54454:122-427(-)|eukprot:CAMPEP_0116996394 /NCGR_PEP_ID=MMETSP0472-20121206/208_1 /TAXON_ID=693140 ORGANISM="Tiarina fusus, Strain LIS" /NCGR_SAMPLE_ID=MMETSP0472 /ASSEMBLY_ACC=CAM_ASM_000603 /LENGTH=101 /DNA_ID=CAMNT_0004694987 /DNA_START=75 /DNA_END=380 /DNA_ORIENTATION=+